MPKFDNDREGGDNFERFGKRPKNPKKGKKNRSNEKQMLKDHLPHTNNEWDEYDDGFMEKWERK